MSDDDIKKENDEEILDEKIPNIDKEIENLEEDDVVFDELDVDGDETSNNPALVLKRLREKIKNLEKENQEYLTGWQKERAESVNLRKRFDEERKEFIKYASQNLTEELLSVLDGFESAMKNKEVWEKVDKNWRIGIEYLNNQLLTILEQNGLKKIYPLGENFDPNLHEAIETVAVEDENQNHKIVEVFQTGYSINGKMLRPPKVKIGELGG